MFPPHGPLHEESEFWYDLKEKALLYEVNAVKRYEKLEADHARTRERGHLQGREWSYHHHYQPHGIYLVDKVVGDSRQKASSSNIELLVRLWLQVEKDEQPLIPTYDERPILPVPKALAMFLSEKQAGMYKEESFTQALALLQAYLTAKAIPKCHSPAS